MYLRGFLSRLPLPGQGVSDFDATAIPEEVEFPRKYSRLKKETEC